jgi:hypothetical protein
MNVVEPDNVVIGMLRDELARCEEALLALNDATYKLPKGSLSVRKKLHNNREYKYHYLKFRMGSRVVNQHVAVNSLKELKDKLVLRKKYVAEARGYKKRISYLKRLLK